MLPLLISFMQYCVVVVVVVDLFYIALSSRLTALFVAYVILNERLAFLQRVLNFLRSGVLTALFSCYMAGAT